jgi:glycosyltransferase involved in cell wall biosynthesis
MPVLSVITINLNNIEGLRKTIDSVLSQKFSDFEYLVIDGGSNDGSIDLIKESAAIITNWTSEPDLGIYNAMNKGILRAKGEYLLFLNSGDILADANVLKTASGQFENKDIIFGDLIILDNQKSEVHKFPDKIDYNYLFSNTIGHPSTFIRRALFRQIGLYNEKLKIVSDWEFFLKAIVINEVSYRHINFPVSVFSLDGLSSLKSNVESIKQEREYVLRSLFPRFNVDFHHYPGLFKSRTAAIYNFFAKNKILYFLMSMIVRLLVAFKNGLLKITDNLFYIYRRFLERIIPSKYKDLFSIPVIINNFNRLEHLRIMIARLERYNFTNILIIDNCSTYPPLLKYYSEECKYRVFRLKKNMGHLALWKTDIYKEFISDYYIYTDPDVIPIDECPVDFMYYFMNKLRVYPRVSKIGFSLKIDDLPDHYSKKNEVIKWEIQNFQNEIEPGLFLASIDTTFALYRPREKGDWKLKALRTGYPYEARHLPWYNDDAHLSEEDIFYANTKLREVGHWT